jgi:predicted RNase H-like nuclease (RuvC/YqgF family)|tara:strand:- start:443 stop:628 length:186 start_codon:yes stop_codon:yes gene_type:complete
MNVHQPTKKISSWPQMVVRLTKERDELIKENKELSKENLELKRRCSDLWRELSEERAKSDS